MKTQVKSNNDKQNVQNVKNEEKKTIMVLEKAEENTEVNPEEKKSIQILPSKVNDVTEVINSFLPSAEDRIKRAENFTIISNKFTHLKTKKDELEKFVLSSDGTKEKIVLENSTGQKFSVSNTTVLEKIKNLMNDELGELLQTAEREVRTFEI